MIRHVLLFTLLILPAIGGFAGDAADASRFADDDYVRVSADGHLQLHSQRIHDLGFNLVRWWGEPEDWSKPYIMGDGSAADLMAYSMAALDRNVSIKSTEMRFDSCSIIGRQPISRMVRAIRPYHCECSTEFTTPA